MVPKSQIHGASQGHQYRKKLFSSHAARHDAADSMLMQSSRGEERTLKTLRLTTNGVFGPLCTTGTGTRCSLVRLIYIIAPATDNKEAGPWVLLSE